MDWDAVVLRAGDRAGAWGRLVCNTQGTWFEPPLPQSLVFIDPRPVNPPFRGAVPVDGADMDLVAEHYERDGAAEGWATVTGTWSGRGLRVERQRARRDAKSGQEPEWTTSTACAATCATTGTPGTSTSGRWAHAGALPAADR